MKGVLGWVKSHLVVVVCTAVVVFSLPVGFVFSSKMNSSIRVGTEKEGSDALRQIQNARVSYVIPSLLPGEPGVELARQAPNAALTAWVKEQRDRRAAEASGVMRRAVEFNRRDHGPLVNGLFPDPPRDDPTRELRLKGELLTLLAGAASAEQPSVYAGLFAEIGAGSPPSPERVFERVRDVEERERERLLADSPSGQLTGEQQAKLTEQLVNRRIGEYQRRAREISVYADLASLDRTGFDKRSSLLPPPRLDQTQGGTPPHVGEFFQWQWDYWIVRDLLAAVERANTASDGDRLEVERAVVKRIERISVEELPLYGDARLPRLSAPEGSVPLDRSISVTGRVSSETNKLYDVRRAKMTVVVSSEGLPVFLDALAQTNMITVLSVNLSDVDVWGDLQKGYFYGREPVVRAELELETLWLRSWTGPLMPGVVRQRLGVELTGEPG